MAYFITNSKPKNFKERLVQLTMHSEEMKFLVGFFYFSGIRELYEGLKSNDNVRLKILVGLDADTYLGSLIEYSKSTNHKSVAEKAADFFDSLRKALNSKEFDEKYFYETAPFFIQLLENNRLQIRKTSDPNHAKLYIFKLNPSQIGRNSLFITGSSNLTYSGLLGQNEFNVEISDYGTEEAEKYFDNLWEEAVEITEKEERKRKLIDLLKNDTLLRSITPFEAYVYALKTYLDTFKGKELTKKFEELLVENGYKKYTYQLDAISQALSVIEQNKGVIIADVVGLGKTVVACGVAFELKKRGIVICPPGLMGDEAKKSGWRKYLEEFGLSRLGWEVFSSGDLEKVQEFLKVAKDVEVVIVDEAHRFRNQDTQSYEQLKNICRGKNVILLTATPFNNSPSDIFSLLKLFIIPKKSTITLTDDITALFSKFENDFKKLSYIKKYHNSVERKKSEKAHTFYRKIFGDQKIDLIKVKNYGHNLANEIKKTIEPVVIRRNRLDLLNNPYYQKEVNELSKIADPIEWFYELTPEQFKFYDLVINQYFASPENGGHFTGAIYRPFEYEVKTTEDLGFEENRQYQIQYNLYDFMRRLLVKRFESSFGAFQKSIENFLKTHKTVIAFVQKTGKYILDRDLLEKIYEEDLDIIEEELKKYNEEIKRGVYPKNYKIYKIDKLYHRDKFIKDIEADIRLFKKVLAELNQLKLVDNDPKFERLIHGINEILSQPEKPKRKIVVFTEYMDTAKYLSEKLTATFNSRVLTVAGHLGQRKIQEIYENFDASYPKQNQKDDFNILLGTDKISEGFNLNRAGMVINYDIPWNPVRVIQRVGRINRISKKVFDDLYIVNFFPTEKGADLVKSREIATQKMFLIHNALGEDAKIFEPDEEPTPSELYTRLNRNPDEIDNESPYTLIVKEYEEIKQKYPQIIESIKKLPTKIKVAKKADKNELFVIIRKGKLFVHYFNSDTGKSRIVKLEEILDRIRVPYGKKPIELSDKFWDYYEKSKKGRTVRSMLSEQSIEQKAINNLKFLLRTGKHERYNSFLSTLLEDLLDYGTLPDYTIRRIADFKQNRTDKIQKLLEELGEDYLEKEKRKMKKIDREIIVAIENRVMAEDSQKRGVD